MYFLVNYLLLLFYCTLSDSFGMQLALTFIFWKFPLMYILAVLSHAYLILQRSWPGNMFVLPKIRKKTYSFNFIVTKYLWNYVFVEYIDNATRYNSLVIIYSNHQKWYLTDQSYNMFRKCGQFKSRQTRFPHINLYKSYLKDNYNISMLNS